MKIFSTIKGRKIRERKQNTKGQIENKDKMVDLNHNHINNNIKHEQSSTPIKRQRL